MDIFFVYILGLCSVFPIFNYVEDRLHLNNKRKKGFFFVLHSICTIFGFAENRMHLGNAGNTFLYFLFTPNLLSKLKAGAKGKNKYIILYFSRFSLSLQNQIVTTVKSNENRSI